MAQAVNAVFGWCFCVVNTLCFVRVVCEMVLRVKSRLCTSLAPAALVKVPCYVNRNGVGHVL
jgi:hypothetical protein